MTSPAASSPASSTRSSSRPDSNPASNPTSHSTVPSTERLTDSHRWKILTIGVAANASFAAVVGGISATGVLMRSAYGLNTSTLGWVLGMLGLGIAISELPWGLLTDRWGDRPILLTGLGSSAIALLGMAAFVAPDGVGVSAVPSVGLLAGGLCVVGLLGSSVNGSSGRAIMSWFRVHERGLAMSIRQTAVPLGYGLGALILPALAAHLGFAYVYGAGALFCLTSAALAWHWLHEPPTQASSSISSMPSTTPAQSPQPGSGASINPMTDGQIWRVVLAIGILCAPQFAVITFGAVFLHDVFGVSTAISGAVLAAVQVGAMVMRVWSGRWTDRHGNRRDYLHACCVISAVAFAALGGLAWILALKGTPHLSSGATTGTVIAVLVICGVSVSAWHGVAYAELAEMAGVARAGTALAMGNMTAFTLLFITPSCIPLLLKLDAWPAVWLAAVACAVAARALFPGRQKAQ